MSKLDWDREQREIRKRKHGTVPHWADGVSLSIDDERAITRALEPLRELIREFESWSATNRSQRAGEVAHRLLKLRRQGEDALRLHVGPDALASFVRRADLLIVETRAEQFSR